MSRYTRLQTIKKLEAKLSTGIHATINLRYARLKGLDWGDGELGQLYKKLYADRKSLADGTTHLRWRKGVIEFNKQLIKPPVAFYPKGRKIIFNRKRSAQP